MKAFFTHLERGKAVLIFLALATAVYATMLLGPLAALEQIAAQKPFDMRPTGYSFEDVQHLIQALGERGKRVYLSQQLPLDFLYPAFFACFIFGAILWLSRNFSITKNWYRYFACLAFVAALADYLENTLIIAMLTTGPADLSPLVVGIASAASVTKAVLTTLVSIILLTALVQFGLSKLRNANRSN